eukprot:1126239-Rhodomonas_salina.1
MCFRHYSDSDHVGGVTWQGPAVRSGLGGRGAVRGSRWLPLFMAACCSLWRQCCYFRVQICRRWRQMGYTWRQR